MRLTYVANWQNQVSNRNTNILEVFGECYSDVKNALCMFHFDNRLIMLLLFACLFRPRLCPRRAGPRADGIWDPVRRRSAEAAPIPPQGAGPKCTGVWLLVGIPPALATKVSRPVILDSHSFELQSDQMLLYKKIVYKQCRWIPYSGKIKAVFV